MLGRHLARELERRGNEVLLLSRNPTVEKGSVRGLATDYTRDHLSEILNGAQAVVHLAGKRGRSASIAEYFPSIAVSETIYAACETASITNVVFTSSISVYSDVTKLPWSEDQSPAPTSHYGICKLAVEHLGNAFTRMTRLRVKNLRLAHLFSENEDNEYMINTFLKAAQRNEPILLDAPSAARREFLYAGEAARAIACALDQPDVAGTFNVGSGEALTNEEVAVAIHEVFGSSERPRVLDHRASERIQSSFMATEMAEEHLNYRTEMRFEQALQKMRDGL